MRIPGNLTAFVAFVLVLFASTDARELSAATLYAETPGITSGVFADFGQVQAGFVISEFVATESGRISIVNFQGLYAPSLPTVPDDFSLFFYNDDPALPGTLISRIDIGADVVRTSIGFIQPAPGFNLEVFDYVARIDSDIELVEGTRYWFGVVNSLGADPNSDWYWGSDLNTVPGFAQSLVSVVDGEFSFSTLKFIDRTTRYFLLLSDDEAGGENGLSPGVAWFLCCRPRGDVEDSGSARAR